MVAPSALIIFAALHWTTVSSCDTESCKLNESISEINEELQGFKLKYHETLPGLQRKVDIIYGNFLGLGDIFESIEILKGQVKELQSDMVSLEEDNDKLSATLTKERVLSNKLLQELDRLKRSSAEQEGPAKVVVFNKSYTGSSKGHLERQVVDEALVDERVSRAERAISDFELRLDDLEVLTNQSNRVESQRAGINVHVDKNVKSMANCIHKLAHVVLESFSNNSTESSEDRKLAIDEIFEDLSMIKNSSLADFNDHRYDEGNLTLIVDKVLLELGNIGLSELHFLLENSSTSFNKSSFAHHLGDLGESKSKNNISDADGKYLSMTNLIRFIFEETDSLQQSVNMLQKKNNDLQKEYFKINNMVGTLFNNESQHLERQGEPILTKFIDVVEISDDESTTKLPLEVVQEARSGFNWDKLDEEESNLVPDEVELITESRGGKISDRYCLIKPPQNENVLVYLDGLLINDFRPRLPTNSIVYFRCEDIGRFDLIGATSAVCQDGHLRFDFEFPPYCRRRTSTQTVIDMIRNSLVNEIKCPETDGYFIHPHDCHMYVICSNWQPNIVNCSQSLAFNPNTQRCEFESNVDCTSRTSQRNIEEAVSKIKPAIKMMPQPDEAGVAVSHDSKLYIYPGTTFELHCVYPKQYGKPEWIVQVRMDPSNLREIINYPRFWEPRDGSEEKSISYGIKIYKAKLADSGSYTCVTPSKQMKKIEVIVKAIQCVEIQEENDLIIEGYKSNKLSAVLKFGCRNGLKLIGSSEIQCLTSGKWSDKLPKCVESGIEPCYDGSCDTIEVKNSLLSSTSYGEYATNQRPGCKKPFEVDQMLLSLIPEKPWYEATETIVFKCPEGYRITGDIQVITCLDDHTWNAEEMPSCAMVGET